MIFNQEVIGKHPATSGYIVECFIRGNENDADFPSGSGRLKIEFPKFEITGLKFEGKNLLIAPTGEELEDKLMESITALEANINLVASFSGDLDTIGDGLGIQNIKNADVYTGSTPDFTPDTLDFSNRVGQFPVSLTAGEESFAINITSGDLTGADGVPKVEQNINYKVVPTDFITFGNESASVSGIMFSGEFPRITDDILISRTNGNDLFVGRGDTVEIMNGCTITIDDTIPLDFSATFRARTTSQIIVSGVGVQFQRNFSQNVQDFGSNDTRLSFTNKKFEEFEIASLLNEAGDARDSDKQYLISEL